MSTISYITCVKQVLWDRGAMIITTWSHQHKGHWEEVLQHTHAWSGAGRLHSGGGLQNHRGKPHLHGFWRPPGRYRVGGSPRGGRTVHSVPRVRWVQDTVYLGGLPTRALQLTLLTVKYNTRNGQAYMKIVVCKESVNNERIGLL